MRHLVILAFVAFLIAGAASHLAEKVVAPAPAAPPVAAKPSPPPERIVARANTLVVPGDRDGHFRVNATINGRSVPFLVDTGATVIALSRRDADRLGVNPAPRDFTAAVQTANGVVRAAPARLAAVSVGSLTVRNVTALVMPEGVLAQNLLGMSFLSRLKRFEIRSGQLVLEQ